jgi:hypothetical protein
MSPKITPAHSDLPRPQGISPQAARIQARVGYAPEQQWCRSIQSSDSKKDILEKSSSPSESMCLTADKDVIAKALEIINFFRQWKIFPPFIPDNLDILNNPNKGISSKQVKVMGQETNHHSYQPESPSSFNLPMEENTEIPIQSNVKQEHNNITAMEPICGEHLEEEEGNQLAESGDVPEEKQEKPLKDETNMELSLSNLQHQDLNHNSEDPKLNDKVGIDDQKKSSTTEATQDYPTEGMKSITPQTLVR